MPPYKVEVKNMNSFKAVEAALEFEIERQKQVLESGEPLFDETRGFVDASRTTISQRIKEGAQDYRYFPEPDLPYVKIPESLIIELRKALPELPRAKLERFVSEYGLPESDITQLVDDKELANYFEHVASELSAWYQAEGLSEDEYKKSTKSAANWLLGDFLALLNRDNKSAEGSNITAENFAELVKMVERGQISVTAGKTVLSEMYSTGGDPSDIMESLNLGQVSDENQIVAAVEKVIAESPDVVEKYKAGKTSVVGVLVGSVMKEMGGKANPKVVNEVLLEKLR